MDLLKKSDVMETEQTMHHPKKISVILTSKTVCDSCGMRVKCEENPIFVDCPACNRNI